MTRESLMALHATGVAVDFLFFWGHTAKDPSRVDAACLSQWFPRTFSVDRLDYRTAEHWMMAEKARLFGDHAALAKILASVSPSDAKALGRSVRNYDDAAWGQARFDAVVRGNLAKFGSHHDLREFLLGTGDRVIVEASPRDTIWGIGMGASNPLAREPSKWRGQNLLGFALMEVRARLRA